MHLDPVAVVLYLMKPLLALRGLGLQRGKLGLNEPRHLNTRSQYLNSQEHCGSEHLGAIVDNLEQSGYVIFLSTTEDAACTITQCEIPFSCPSVRLACASNAPHPA